MSKHLTILPAVAALLLSAACSNDDMDGVLADGPVAAQVTADISNGQTATRVSTDGTTASFTAGDVIHVVAGGSATYDYTLQSDGSTWQASTPYYFQDFTSVSFQGWYSTAAATDNSISIDTKTQTTDATTGWNNWDILATPAVSASAISPKVDFTGVNTFQHVMSQVTFTFTAGDDVSNLEALKGYTLKNLITDAAFDTQACTLAAGSTTGDISQTVTATSETTELACTPLILVPQEVDGKLTLEVTYNDLTYTAELSLPSNATALAAGKHYIYTVSIDNTGLTIGSATIEAWTTKGEQEGDATIIPDCTYTEDGSGIRTYTVYSENGLLAWAEYASCNLNTNCTLGDDITLTSEWTAVGTESNPYTGTFDGNGYTITGLTISASSGFYQGLIGDLGTNGVVKNLTMEDVSISSTSGSFFGAVVGRNYGTVTNCYTSGEVSGSWYTGGVVGDNDISGTVTDCYSTCTVKGSEWYAGGVVGQNNGGIVTACYSTGEVSGTNYVGGVVGYNTYSGTVTACYSTGTVSGTNYIGGVVGFNGKGTVTACYATGIVSGGTYTGGVVGFNFTDGTVTTCYWNNDATNGIGYDYNIESDSGSGSNDNATKVDGEDVTWQSAASAMNTELTSKGWQYEENSDTSGAPLILKEVTE